MKIEDFKLNDIVRDDWGNTLKVVKILKTRVKLIIETKSISGIHTYEGIAIGDTVTYDKAHLMFLHPIKKDYDTVHK